MFNKILTKRTIALLMAATMIFSLCACGNKNDENPVDNEPVVEDVVDGEDVVVDDLDVTDEDVELTVGEQVLVDMYDMSALEFPVMTWAVDLTDAESVKSITGLDSADKIVAAAVSEPAMSSQAYSVVIVELADEADAEAVAEEMKNGVNPRKWICVEADDMEVVIEGKYVCLAMISSEYAEAATAKGLTEMVVDILTGADVPAEDVEAPAEEVPAEETPAETPAAE